MTPIVLTFLAVSSIFNLPEGLLSSICLVESGHSTAAIHYNDKGSDSLGVCQIKLKTAQFVGFKGTHKELLDPAYNIYYAGKYLRYQLYRYNNDTKKAISAYNMGKCVMKLGRIKNNLYVSKVFNAWRLASNERQRY